MIERFVSPPSSVGIVDVRPYKNRKQKILASERAGKWQGKYIYDSDCIARPI